MAATISSTSLHGTRLLREISNSECTLEELLRELRASPSIPQPSKTGLRALDALWHAHGTNQPLNICGRGMPLVYHVIDHMITVLGGTVAVVDVEGRFSPSHLVKGREGRILEHVHVFRVIGGLKELRVTLEGLEGWMVEGEHGSKGREWVGTVVIGGVGGDVNVGWRGWLRVERDEVVGFKGGVSVEEVLAERESRQEVVDEGGWRAVCEDGIYCWK